MVFETFQELCREIDAIEADMRHLERRLTNIRMGLRRRCGYGRNEQDRRQRDTDVKAEQEAAS